MAGLCALPHGPMSDARGQPAGQGGQSLRTRIEAGRTRVAGKDDTSYAVRPIHPSDAPSLMRGYDALSEQGKWFRMLHAVPHLTAEMAAHFSDPDPETEVCVVIEGRGALSGEIVGGARVADLGAGRAAEFSVSLRPEMRGLGLARQALQIVIELAREAGCRSIYGIIARRNTAMLGLARRLGFEIVPDPDDMALLRAELTLEAPHEAGPRP